MATKKAAAKKSVTKKAAPRKTTARKPAAKRSPAKTTARKTSSSRSNKRSTAPKISKATTEFAEIANVKNSRYSSGRERDEMAKQQGLDPAEVRAEMHRLRVERLTSGS
jgi:hypothetical protein